MTVNEAYERLGRVVYYTWEGLNSNEVDQAVAWERIYGAIDLFDYFGHYGAFGEELSEKDAQIK